MTRFVLSEIVSGTNLRISYIGITLGFQPNEESSILSIRSKLTQQEVPMDIQGYDEWRLQGPDDFYQEIDIVELTQAAEEMADDMLTGDSERVEYLMCQDEVWYGRALSFATGDLTQCQFKQLVVDMVAEHLLDDCLDEVLAYHDLQSCPF